MTTEVLCVELSSPSTADIQQLWRSRSWAETDASHVSLVSLVYSGLCGENRSAIHDHSTV